MITLAQLRSHYEAHAVPPVLHCAECDGAYSAHPGDYFYLTDEHVFECCGEPMTLVVPYSGFRTVAS